MNRRRILIGCGAVLGVFWASCAATFVIGTTVERKRRAVSASARNVPSA